MFSISVIYAQKTAKISFFPACSHLYKVLICECSHKSFGSTLFQKWHISLKCNIMCKKMLGCEEFTVNEFILIHSVEWDRSKQTHTEFS